jgi:endonuclease I
MRRATLASIGVLTVLASSHTATAQPPSGYYASASNLTGEALRGELHSIITGHTVHPYRSTHDFVDLLDEDPNDADRVILIYSGRSEAKDNWGDYNREALWPPSLGADRRPAQTDMHHIFAVDRNVNLSRGSKFYDDCEEDCHSHAEAPNAPYDVDSWEPPDEVKGDIARALFYMAVRYEGDNGEPDLELINETPERGCNCMGRLETLLAWHDQDPVDDRERRRNDLIFNEIQGNRNPFVDHPEWVRAIWGGVPGFPIAEGVGGPITIASFNIKFLGHYLRKDDEALATVLDGCDIVVVQELVAPPVDGHYPDNEPFERDEQAAEFFSAMADRGFDYVLSVEDTGPSDDIHVAGTATEWWVAFFDPARVRSAFDLPSGFLEADRSANQHFDRVPYAFAFRTMNALLDFVLVPVHLRPGLRNVDAERRREELGAVHDWIESQGSAERDYIILGDMNIEDADELESDRPDEFVSLNEECRATNTNSNSPRPFDHVMVNPAFTTEVDAAFGLRIVNLIDAFRQSWSGEGVYPGDPYDHNLFSQIYSDHNPIMFRLVEPAGDDD